MRTLTAPAPVRSTRPTTLARVGVLAVAFCLAPGISRVWGQDGASNRDEKAEPADEELPSSEAPLSEEAAPDDVETEKPADPAPIPPSPQRGLFQTPELLESPDPEYPEEALAAGVEGSVVLLLTLDAEGAVTSTEVVRGPDPGLAAYATEAIAKARFAPPPDGDSPHALRRYFHVVRFVLPEDRRPPPDPDAPPPPEIGPELTQLPTMVVEVPAEYPETAREAGIQGRALLELDVSADGRMDAVRLLDEVPAGWSFGLEAAIAAWQFEFTPALAGTAPVPVRITYTYSFTLEEKVVMKVPTVPDEGADADAEGPVNLAGVVRERGSRRPLGGVDVFLESAGLVALTNDAGAFEFRGVPVGLHRAVVAVPGYERFETEEEIQPGELTEVVYFLRETALGAPETIVRVRKERKEVTRRSIAIETIEHIPGTFGDPVRVIQNLPGVSRSPFDFGLLLIRGSGPEDSGPHIDGIRVPQLFHFGGLRSIMTPVMLESVDFYPGGFGVRYGRLTGGILDIRTRTEYEESIHGLVQADLIDVSAAITGTIPRKGGGDPVGGFVFAARRSYLDIILPAITPASVDISRIIFPRWTDVQGKITLHPTPADSVSVLAYYSQDRAGTRIEDPASATRESTQGDFSIKTDFWRAGMSWKHRPGTNFVNELTWSVGQDVQTYGIGQFATFSADFFYGMLRDEARIRLDDHLSLVVGADIIASYIDFSFAFNAIDVRTFGSDPNVEREALTLEDTVFAFAPAVFAEARLSFADDRVKLVPGIRPDVYWVPDQFAIATLDPRFAFRITPDPDRKIDIKGSVGLYHQNPQPYEILDITGDPNLAAEESIQVTAGVEVRFTDFLSLDVQGFYKRLDKLVVFSTQGTRDGGSDGAWSNSGDGHIYGAEFFLRWESFKNFEGWIALTLQRSKRRDQIDEDFYWYDFDQPVILDIVASYKLPAGFRIGARWRFVSGNPETPFITAIYDADADSYIALNGDYNSERLPNFHALDIRIDKDINFRRWKLTFYLDIQNVYNRKNPEATIYNFDFTEKEFLYSLPILPNIGFKAQF
jgi:TonB family protein